ncbi:hypothetical protein CRG98_025749 [Punica granatum]|nr:hypothetical protein CRG98_025749 [Punica granatum]
MMYYADHHGFPIITFIDTPGAFADLKSEELGQGEAIAHNLRTMFGLKVPIVSIVIGEGGSGGALAIGCANKLLMLENAVFYVASPEACAAILWKSAKASPKAAEKLRITGTELCKLQIADGIIPEPLGGAHVDPSWTSQQIKAAIVESMNELKEMNTEDLLKHRMLKFRKIGGFQEGIPIDPKRKVNMKKKEEPMAGQISDKELEGEVEKLKQQILKAKESSTELSESGLNEMIAKLKREVDHEFNEAVKAMGLNERLEMLREEFSKANSGDQIMHPGLMDKIDKLIDEFNQGLSEAPNYASLKNKLGMLKDLCRAKNEEKVASLKLEINKKFNEVLDRPEIKQKMEALKAEVESSGATSSEDIDEELKKKILQTRKEIEAELVQVLESMGLGVETVKSVSVDLSQQIPLPDVKGRIENLNEKVNQKIEEVMHSPDVKNLVETLKMEVAKAGNIPDSASKSKIEALEQQIRMKVSDAINSSELKEELEELTGEILKVNESSLQNGSLKGDSPVEVNVPASNS